MNMFAELGVSAGFCKLQWVSKTNGPTEKGDVNADQLYCDIAFAVRHCRLAFPIRDFAFHLSLL